MLPIAPQGTLNDVDQDAETDTGVQIFQVAFWDNRYGDNSLDEREAGAWSNAYSSARGDTDPRGTAELTGGKLIVYAPDDAQGFPSGFGQDGLLFTADDPIVSIPAGYTVVDMDTAPFTFDRSREPVLDLIEPESDQPEDFSELSYLEAFDALIEYGKREYAFTEEKAVDWGALSEQYRAIVEAAEAEDDFNAYAFALYDMLLSIPDGHIFSFAEPTETDENFRIGGGVGLAVRELSDGRVLVNYVLEDGPAAQAGIEFGAEIIAVDGVPVSEAVANVRSVNAPYSLPNLERLDQLRFLFRMPVETEIEVTYRNLGAEEDATASLVAVPERESLVFSRQFVYGSATAPLVAPVDFEFLESGYGLVTVNTFGGFEQLIVSTWEYFLDLANQSDAPGIIIDLRVNGGGFVFIAARLASYLYSEPIEVYFDESYTDEVGDFYFDERFPVTIEPEVEGESYYDGEVVVLVGPGCASACEFFAHMLTLQDRSTVVGQYGTNGIAGGYFETPMPGGIVVALPTSRPIDMDGNVIIESMGIQPDVVVPVTEENMAETQQDVVLQAALDYLDEVTALEVSEGAAVAIGDSLTSELGERQRVQFPLEVEAGAFFSIFVESDEFDTYVRLYFADGADVIAENDDIESGNTNSALEELEVPQAFSLIVEVGSFGDAAGGSFTLTIENLNAAPEAEGTAQPEATPDPEATAEPGS
ncbi:MAG: PDZ domain-containing protein [Anaerolineae bacterium]|nr:PDZ domain-containing protein [Anaerolineae bacterium]